MQWIRNYSGGSTVLQYNGVQRRRLKKSSLEWVRLADLVSLNWRCQHRSPQRRSLEGIKADIGVDVDILEAVNSRKLLISSFLSQHSAADHTVVSL